MGIFSKVGDWLTEKSDRFIRGDAPAPNSYYASDEYEEAYGGMRDGGEAASREAGSATGSFAAAGNQKDYGGRVPYQSQRDLQQRAQEQAYAQQTAGYSAAQGTGRMPPVAAPQAAPAPGMGQTPGAQPGFAQNPYATQGFAPVRGQEAYPPQPQQGPVVQRSNVVPFPGMQRGPDGGLYAHVEYIVLLRSRNECKNVIEYIKQNASVFLNMEFIANDSERQRCVDMLSGAAYTLGCALNKISPRGIYLISSPSVYVVIDPAMQKMASGLENRAYPRAEAFDGYTQRQSYSAGAQTSAYAAAQPGGFQPTGTYTAQTTGAYAPVTDNQTARRAAQQSAFAGAATGAFQAASGTGSFRPVAGARTYGEYQQ